MLALLKLRMIILSCCLMPLNTIAQWSYHYYFPTNINYWCEGYFKDALYLSVDTGFYCYTQACPGSNETSALLVRSVDDFATWEWAHDDNGLGCSSYAIKYFPPYLYYLYNWQGMLRIIYGLNGFGLWSLPAGLGFYMDFYANSPNDYKIIYDNGKFVHWLNGSIVMSQNFSKFQLQKMYFPIDTVGIFIARVPSSTVNTLVVKYSPAFGFNIVYDNPSSNMDCIEFTEDLTGYIGGSDGFMIQSDDLGSTWNLLSTNINKKLNSIDFIDNQTGYAVGEAQSIIMTNDKGLTWYNQTAPYPGNYKRVFFVSQDDGFILFGQQILKTTNGGITWLPEEKDISNDIVVKPNPGLNDFTIALPENSAQNLKYRIIVSDMTGNIVIKQDEIPLDGSINIFLKDVRQGVYQLVLISDENQFQSKLIVR